MQNLIVILICSAAALGCTALGMGLFIVSPQSHVDSKAKRHVSDKPWQKIFSKSPHTT